MYISVMQGLVVHEFECLSLHIVKIGSGLGLGRVPSLHTVTLDGAISWRTSNLKSAFSSTPEYCPYLTPGPRSLTHTLRRIRLMIGYLSVDQDPRSSRRSCQGCEIH